MMYTLYKKQLRNYYDKDASERDYGRMALWKLDERACFLSFLQREKKRTLLDIGSGTGTHAMAFQDNSFKVFCVDMSYEMSKVCQEKGLTTCTMDFMEIGFVPMSFDAIFSLNSLLHVPRNQLDEVLCRLSSLLKPQGLLYWGQYGGYDLEELQENERHATHRFFSYLSDDNIVVFAQKYFSVIRFTNIHIRRNDNLHFHSVIMRLEHT